MFDAARRGDPQAERRFFFFLVLPCQSVLLTAYVAPMYGFNALIQPLNQIFSPEDPASGWAGAVAGGAVFLTIGTSGLVGPTLQRWTRTPHAGVWAFALGIPLGARLCPELFHVGTHGHVVPAGS